MRAGATPRFHKCDLNKDRKNLVANRIVFNDLIIFIKNLLLISPLFSNSWLLVLVKVADELNGFSRVAIRN